MNKHTIGDLRCDTAKEMKPLTVGTARLTNAEFQPEVVQEIVKLLKGKTLDEGAYILKQVLNYMKSNARIQ